MNRLLILMGVLLPVFAQTSTIGLRWVGGYQTGIFDESAMEIAAYDPVTQTLFVVNGSDNSLDLINISDPSAPEYVEKIDLDSVGNPNSVAIHDGMVAIAVSAKSMGVRGQVFFYETEGKLLEQVQVGFLPDMVTFTPDGQKVLVANEGEPNASYTLDPEGSISIIDVATFEVEEVSFTAFERDDLSAEIRIKAGATPAEDFEPEYIAISADSKTAFVTLQENNSIAVIDIEHAAVTEIFPLGYKDHSISGNGLDASRDDGEINIKTWKIMGMYQPDAIVAFEVEGVTYLLTANEGELRDLEGYSDMTTVAEVTLDRARFPNAAGLQELENIGGLAISSVDGDTDGDGDLDVIYAAGGRSFSIWTTDGQLVFDSGDQFEQIIAQRYPEAFNSSDKVNDTFDSRSSGRGPEPEGATIGVVNGRIYAFIGLERMGGVMVYDVTDPAAPIFVTYSNTRDFSGDPLQGTAGDLSPEGVLFIKAEDSPTGKPLLVLSNEASGSITIFEILQL